MQWSDNCISSGEDDKMPMLVGGTGSQANTLLTIQCAELLPVCLVLMVANLSLALLTWRRALAVKTGGEAMVRNGSARCRCCADAVLDKDYLIRPSVVPTEKRKISRISSLTKQQLAEESQGARKILQRIHIGSNGGGGGSG